MAEAMASMTETFDPKNILSEKGNGGNRK